MKQYNVWDYLQSNQSSAHVRLSAWVYKIAHELIIVKAGLLIDGTIPATTVQGVGKKFVEWAGITEVGVLVHPVWPCDLLYVAIYSLLEFVFFQILK